MDKLNRLQRLVFNVIRANPGVENNEAALTAAVWRVQGWSEFNSLEENLARVSNPETISRRRRELHQKGLITYSKEALTMREEAFRNERDRAITPRFVNECAD